MTISQRRGQPLIRPGDLPPTDERFEVIGTFNPSAIRTESEVILLVRVAERPREQRPGYTGLPRWDSQGGGLVIDWVSDLELDPIDPRVVRLHQDGRLRLTFTSHLRAVYCGDGLTLRTIGAPFTPAGELEEYGVEDPRMTLLNGRYYFTYVAVSRHGPATALASTTDFKAFQRHGVIFCPENKDVVLFPEKIADEYVALHRPVCGSPFTRPEIWLARSPDLTHWGKHEPMGLSGRPWQSGRVGAGAPPIRVNGGWLEVYHGNQRPSQPGEVGTYHGAVLLLDADDPSRILAQSVNPLLFPEADYETDGFVPNVVFPTGLVEKDDTLLLYYGAADTCTGVLEVSEQALLASLT